jgi:pteridine reductase
MLDLVGKRALVTGAGRRVGAEIALALGACGMRVGVHYHSAATQAELTCEGVRAAGGEAYALPADLSADDGPRSLVERALDVLSGLDLLVLSAANFERTPFAQIDERQWDDAMALNLRAPFALAQCSAPALRATRGSIVLVTCISHIAPYRDYLPYETSKAGVYQLMRLLALELAPEVRVNAVAPGSVKPPDSFSAAQLDALAQRIPLGRLGQARDVADAVVHLAQSDWMTGSEIVVDGGRSLM